MPDASHENLHERELGLIAAAQRSGSLRRSRLTEVEQALAEAMIWGLRVVARMTIFMADGLSYSESLKDPQYQCSYQQRVSWFQHALRLKNPEVAAEILGIEQESEFSNNLPYWMKPLRKEGLISRDRNSESE